MRIYWICYKDPKLNFAPIIFPYSDEEKRDKELAMCIKKYGNKQITSGESTLL